METLKRLTLRTSSERRNLPSGRIIEVPAWVIHFPPALPDRLPSDATYWKQPHRRLPGSYLNKPLVDVEGEPLFGELAIARWLERDGWDAVWVDSYHSSKKNNLFWRNLPDRSEPFDLSSAAIAYNAYQKIHLINNGVGGFFDVLAWKQDRVVYVEYKGAGDRPNKNETRWLDSALTASVAETDLYFVLH